MESLHLFASVLSLSVLSSAAASIHDGPTHITNSASGTISFPLVPHHVQRQRRLSQLREANPSNFRRRDEALQVNALYHGFGTHYIDLWCGTPPQRQTVIVDTGSSLSAFPCSKCSDCGAPRYHIDDYFQEEQSSSFSSHTCDECQRGTCNQQTNQCRISQSYAEGSSWHAYEAEDLCYVGGPHNMALTQEDMGVVVGDIDPNHAAALRFPLTFGCQTGLTGLFKTQLADGIMGMEMSQTSFWKQMYNHGIMGEDQQFSLCFSRPPETSRDGTEAGAMTLGGVETKLHDTQMVWTDGGEGHSGFFDVKVRAVYMREGGGGDSAKSTDPDAEVVKLDVASSVLNAGGVIVDSGTTDTYWSRGIQSAFRKAFRDFTGKAYSHDPMTLTQEELQKLPTLLFQLEGDEERNSAVDPDPTLVNGLAAELDPEHPYDVILALPPFHYLELNSQGQYISRFYDTESSGSVFGANSMMGHDILFDGQLNQLGWAESKCDYANLLADNGFTDVLDEITAGVTNSEDTQVEVVNEDDSKDKDPTDVPDENTTEVADSEDVENAQTEVIKEDNSKDNGSSEAPDETISVEEKEQESSKDVSIEEVESSFDEPDQPEMSSSTDQEQQESILDEKKSPSSGNTGHNDDQAPVDDVKKAFDGVLEACDSGGCRGGILGSIFLIMVCGCFCGWCHVTRERKAKRRMIEQTELELARGNFSNYLDDSAFTDDTLDGEYGEFKRNSNGLT